MEYAAGGTVRKALDLCKEDLQNDVITDWALQIANGMEYLHSKDIVHSHLKSAQGEFLFQLSYSFSLCLCLPLSLSLFNNRHIANGLTLHCS